MSKLIHNEIDVDTLSTERRLALAIAVFILEGELHRVSLLELLPLKIALPTEAKFREFCTPLVERGYLCAAGNSGYGVRNHYRLDCRLSGPALEVLARTLDEEHAWPDARMLVNSEYAYFGYMPSMAMKNAERTLAEAELFRYFLCPSAPLPNKSSLGMLTQPQRGVLLARKIAGKAVAFCSDEPVDAAMECFRVFRQAYLAWLNFAFLQGCDVRRTLAGLKLRLEEKITCLGRTFDAVYGALCLWTGFVDGLSPILADRDGEIRAGVYGRIAEGRFDKAADAFLGMLSFPSQPQDDAGVFVNFPARLLMVFAAVAEKPEKPPKTAPVNWLNANLSDAARPRRVYGSTTDISEKSYNEYVAKISAAAGNMWRVACRGNGEWITGRRGSIGATLPEVLLAAWDYRCLAAGRSSAQSNVLLLARKAVDYAKAGYPTVARLMAALLDDGLSADIRSELDSAIGSAGLKLIAVAERVPEWKNFIAELTKVNVRAVNKGKNNDERAKKMSIRWCVEIEEEQGGLCQITGIAPVLHVDGSPEDGSEDEILRPDSLMALKYHGAVTDFDLYLVKAIEANNGWYDEDAFDIFHALTRVADVRLCEDVDDYSYYHNPTQIRKVRFVEKACSLVSQLREDGGVSLGVPRWALSSGLDKRGEAFVVNKANDDLYEVTRLSSEAKKLVAVFAKYGAAGSVTIPPEGVAAVEKLVAGMADVLPVAEPAADAAEKLTRVEAESTVRVRLVFEEGVLTIRAVVRPIADNPRLVLDPGIGQAEKLITGTLSPYVLVRDLEAETSGFNVVRNALVEAENWFDGAVTWRIDDIAAAIAALGALKALGESVPVEWLDEKKLNVVYAPKSGVTLKSRRTADDWFRVEGEFAFDDGRVMNVVQMIEAAKNRIGDYVRLSDGDYLALTKTMARELDALAAASRRKGDGLELVKAAIPMLDNVFGEGEDAIELPEAVAATAEEIRSAFSRRPRPPATLTAELRPYQIEGYRWLSRLAACGFGSCLADDMGLGKTVQVIALLLERAANGPSLVFAPASVCGNWRNELRCFAPTLNPVMAMEDVSAVATAKAGDVVIASYGYLLFHMEEFSARTWNGLVLDEAQAIKNDASKRAKAVKDLSACFRVAATGTPVENRLGELWSLFDFLNPGLLGPAASFASRFTVEGKATNELKRLVKPLILRRLKGDVLDDLPEKTEITLPVILGADERTAYEGCRRHALEALEKMSEGEGGANRMSILAELTRLRRFCCHPSLVLPEAGVASAKMEALVDLLSGLKEGRHRALVFSQFTDYLVIVRKVIDAHGWSALYLDGSTPTLEREKLVNAFQRGEGDFFLISLKAGGTGLNLTAANYVILLDPWWNPAVENQAADRAHRIGQKNPVTVYRLIASDTVEARVLELHKEKREIAEDVLDGTSSAALSPDQLMRLFG